MPSWASELDVESKNAFDAQALAAALRTVLCVVLFDDDDGLPYVLKDKILPTPSHRQTLLASIGIDMYEAEPRRGWAIAYYHDGDLKVFGRNGYTVWVEEEYWSTVIQPEPLLPARSHI